MKKKLVCCVLAAAAAAAVIICDSKYNLQLTEYNLHFASLPPQFEGLKIVQLSDLHGSIFGEDNSRLAELVRQQEPDLILLTGDFAENESQLAATEGLLRSLDGCAPIYWVNGNHEYNRGGVLPQLNELLDSFSVRRLVNEYEPIIKGEGSIIIAGADDPNGRADMIKPDALAEQIRREYPDSFILWLGHRNHWVRLYPELPVNLIFSGHGHGGIVRLPFVGGLLNVNHSFIANFESGVYEGEQFQMVVSRGLGNSIKVPRVFNRPEVVSVILHSSK